jgi:hypothetical protein
LTGVYNYIKEVSKMAKVDKSLEDEAIVTQILTRIANQYGCTLDIDYDTHTVNFIGDESKKIQIALELEKFFQCY